MMIHRRKLALLAALALLLGSVAASAANYASGKGAQPSLAGAGDALGMAFGGAVNASAWMASRSRNAVDEVLAYLRPSSTAPAEVETAGGAAPRARSRSLEPADAGAPRQQIPAFSAKQPDHIHPASFEGVRVAPGTQRVPAFDVTLPALPGGGGGEPILRIADVVPALPPAVAPIPEPETYLLFTAGLALIGGVARRRGKVLAA